MTLPEINVVNTTEMVKLANYLSIFKIPYVLEAHRASPGLHLFYPSKKNCKCSVIQTDFSYGGDIDRLEIMGLLTPEEELHDVVVGYLTAEDVATRIINHFWAWEAESNEKN